MPEHPVLQRVRALVLAHGWNATAYQLLNPGLTYWFAPHDAGVVGFVTVRGLTGRYLVVAGEPVAPPDRLDAVTRAFEAWAAQQRATICYFGADERLRTTLADKPRYSVMNLGAQPVWDPQGWDAIIRRRASLRAQLNRARNKGVGVERWSAVQAHGSPALQTCLTAWLAAKPMPPMHFLVEPDTLDRLADRRVYVAEQVRDGVPRTVGFLVASPVPARRGWLVEQFVRAPSAPNGTAELLVDAAMRDAAASGDTYLTLGLSPLSSKAVELGAPSPLWLQGLLFWVRAHGRRFYNFQGLETFKAKFQPDRWDPITAITHEPRPSLATLYAIATAFAGSSTPFGLLGGALRQAVRLEARALRRRLKG